MPDLFVSNNSIYWFIKFIKCSLNWLLFKDNLSINKHIIIFDSISLNLYSFSFNTIYKRSKNRNKFLIKAGFKTVFNLSPIIFNKISRWSKYKFMFSLSSKLFIIFLKASTSFLKSVENTLLIKSSQNIIFAYSFNLLISSFVIVSIVNLNFLSNSNLLALFRGNFILFEIKTLLLNFEFLVKVFLLCIFCFFSILLFCFLLLLNTVLLDDNGPLLFMALSGASYNLELLFLIFSFSFVLFELFCFFLLLDFIPKFFSFILLLLFFIISISSSALI